MLRIFKENLSFQTLYTKPIPGTDLQLMFLQMDSQKMFDFTKKHYMHPNSENYQVTGIHRAVVELPSSSEVSEFLSKVFPSSTETEDGITYKMKDTTLDFHFNQKRM